MVLAWHSTVGLVHAVRWEKVKLIKMLLGRANSI